MYGIWRVRGGGHAEARRKDQDLPAGFRDLVQPSAVEVQLELLAPVAVPATMPLSWGFSVRWFATFGGADRRLTEQGRNRGWSCIELHGLDDLGERVVWGRFERDVAQRPVPGAARWPRRAVVRGR